MTRSRCAPWLCVAGTLLAACQDFAPRERGSSLLYVTGSIRTLAGVQQLAIRLDRQACFTPVGRLNFRDASGLGVLVINQPPRPWATRHYAYPQNSGAPRGYLNISGIVSSYPVVRASTIITRTDSAAIEGELDWTIGEPLGDFLGDTTVSRLRVVGRFSAVPGCDA
jgi:hypothetical protein